MNLETIIAEVQEAVGATPDGKAGPDTWTKIRAKLLPDRRPDFPPPIEVVGDRVDERSEKAIATLLPEVRPYARALIHRAAARGITIKITSGTRTYAEQDALYAKGNVTKARGGYSNHNFGIAFDVTMFNGATPVWESPAYKAVGAIGADLGLDWGGNWKSFKDEPHFQLRPAWARDLSEREMLAELRARKASGKGVFA